MKNDPQIDFYKTGVFSVLKRYEFSDKEKQIIEAAILTAKQDKPKMALVEKADALLKMVASSREPIDPVEEIDYNGIAKTVAQTNMKKYKAPPSAWTAPIERHSSSFLRDASIIAVIVLTIIYVVSKIYG